MTPLPEPDINTASHIHMRIVGHTSDQLRAYGADEYKRALSDAAEYLESKRYLNLAEAIRKLGAAP